MHTDKNRFAIRIAIILLAGAGALLVSQHWGMMLSNSDDPWLMRASWEDVKAFATSQRRFWMLIINSITRWPYQLGGWELTNATKMVINSMVLLAFGLFLHRLAGLAYALICVLSWLCFMDVSNGYYSPFHGYVLMFNLPMGLLFISLWWYLKLIDLGMHGWRLVGPYLLFGLALLGYEPMMFFAGAFPAVALYRQRLMQPSGGIKVAEMVRAVIGWLRHNWMLGVVITVFCGIYFGFRVAHRTEASGSIVHFGDSIEAVLKTVFRFSVYGFRVELAPVFDGDSAPAWLAAGYGLLLALAAFLILPMVDRTKGERLLKSPWGIALLCYFTFSPNLLHALTEGYRLWASNNPYYVGNYLSSFGLSMLVANGLSALCGGIQAQRERLVMIVAIYVLANSAVSNMQKWTVLASNNRADAHLWKDAIGNLQQLHSRQSPEQIWQVCARRPPEKVSGDDRFWSYVLSEKLNSPVIYRSKQLNGQPCDVTLDFDTYRLRP